MPAPGTVWASGAWDVDAWAADTWAEAIEGASPPIQLSRTLYFTRQIELPLRFTRAITRTLRF